MTTNTRIFKLCSYINEDGWCICEEKCDTFTYFKKVKSKYVLAPRPDGKCYCGGTKIKNGKKNCKNLEYYGYDCQGFL